MTTTVLGRVPGDVLVPLTRGSDYEVEITYLVNDVVTDWPASTVLTLVFSVDGTDFKTFTATIVDAVATFAEDKANIEDMPLSCDVRLVYTNGTTDRVLLLGRAHRNG